MYYMYDNNYLAHEGVAGMRWGVRHGPPYPLLRNAAGKLKARAQAKRKAKSEARAAKAEAKTAKSAEEVAAKREGLKTYLREHPAELYKHRNDLTKEEVDKIMSQIEWDRRVKDISAAEHKRNMDRMMNVLKTGATIAENTSKIINGYNTIKKALSSQQNNGQIQQVKQTQDPEAKKKK